MIQATDSFQSLKKTRPVISSLLLILLHVGVTGYLIFDVFVCCFYLLFVMDQCAKRNALLLYSLSIRDRDMSCREGIVVIVTRSRPQSDHASVHIVFDISA